MAAIKMFAVAIVSSEGSTGAGFFSKLLHMVVGRIQPMRAFGLRVCVLY